MDSNKYNEIVNSFLNNNINKHSNYVRTVGRQLTVFSSHYKIKEYIESKVQRIYKDYNVSDRIKWNKDSHNIVKINKDKNISFPSSYIKDNQEHFLTDIPYGIALFLYKTSQEQTTISLPLKYWLYFITLKFFNFPLYKEFSFTQVEDVYYDKELISSQHYILAKKGNVTFFKNNNLRAFYSNLEFFSYFYIKYDLRHILFKLEKHEKI